MNTIWWDGDRQELHDMMQAMESASSYDAILLLCGGGVAMDGSVSSDVQERLDDFLAHEGKQTDTPIIISGGYAYKADARPAKSEAEAYRDYLASKGWVHESTYLEDTSPDTGGNLVFSKIDILEKLGFRNILILPGPNHSEERVRYLARKVLGPGYTWDIRQFRPNHEAANMERERNSLEWTRQYADDIPDGDHQAILRRLRELHPAYGTNTVFSLEDMRRKQV